MNFELGILVLMNRLSEHSQRVFFCIVNPNITRMIIYFIQPQNRNMHQIQSWITHT